MPGYYQIGNDSIVIPSDLKDEILMNGFSYFSIQSYIDESQICLDCYTDPFPAKTMSSYVSFKLPDANLTMLVHMSILLRKRRELRGTVPPGTRMVNTPSANR